MTNTLTRFKPEDYLFDDASRAEYLTLALDAKDPNTFLEALDTVARAIGMSNIAAASGLTRESLYKALRSGSKPYFDTVRRVFAALGLKLAAVPA